MLDNRQKRYLKALVHAKKPIVIVGDGGLTPAVLNEINLALDYHELIKVRVNAEDRESRAQLIEQICQTLNTELVQRVGHVAALFRQNTETQRIQLP